MTRDNSKEGSGLTKRAAMLAVAKGLAFALAFPLPLVLVRTLNQSDFGVYKQFSQVMLTALGLLSLHVGWTAFFFFPRYPDKKPQIVMNVMAFYLALGLPVALLFAVYPQWVTLVFKSDALVAHVPLLGLAILFWLVSAFLETVSVADRDTRSASIFIIALQLIKSGLLMASAVLFADLRTVLLAVVIHAGLQCVVLFWYLRKSYGSFWRAFDWPLLKAQLANALPFGVGGIVYATQFDLHNYFVGYYFDPAGFAIYAVGCFQIPLLTLLLESVSSVLMPEVARLHVAGDKEAIVALWAAAVRKLAIFFVPACTFLFVMRREFIVSLFTASYEEATPIFGVSLIGVFLSIAVTNPMVRAFDQFRFFRLKLYAVLLPLTCLALYAGIKTAGMLGAIVAVVAVQGLDLAITVSVIGRELGFTRRELRRLTPVVRTAMASAVAALATLAVKMSLPYSAPKLSLVLTAAVFGAVYLASASAAGVISDAEKAEMVRFYRVGWRRAGFGSPTELQREG
jgi:O-antigen/teichoic acid export membrane protein